MPAEGGVTELLRKLAEVDRSALDRLVPLVYAELHRMAASYLKRENPDHTLQATCRSKMRPPASRSAPG